MKDIKKEKLIKMLDKSNRAFLIYEIDKPITFYANKQAFDLYGDNDGKVHVYDMFETKEASPFLKADIREELKKAMSVTMYDVATVTNTGEVKLSDLQIGYNDDEKKTIFIELSFKEDNRMEIAKNQIFTSNRAEGIFNFDERLTALYTNTHFCDIFEANGELQHSHYNNQFANAISPETREEKIAEIHEGLKNSLNYTTQVNIITVTGKTSWYSLDLQRRFLDDTGEKLFAYLVCIENQLATEHELEDMNNLFNTMQSLSDDLLYRIDVKNNILYRTKATANLYNVDISVENFIENIKSKSFFHPDDIDDYIEFCKKLLQGIEGIHTARIKVTSGNYEYHKFTFKKLLNSDGSLKEMVGKAVNIQELVHLEEKASYDLLTHTLNKISFEEQAKIVLNRNEDVRHALLFIDLDDFKGVNDNLGHSFGDYLLKNVGVRLRKYVRGGDLVGRVGGDEFVIFLENCFGEEKLVERSEKILTELQKMYEFENKSISIKGSIGIAVYPQHGKTYEELYSNADTALYKSKNGGKNIVTVFDYY